MQQVQIVQIAWSMEQIAWSTSDSIPKQTYTDAITTLNSNTHSGDRQNMKGNQQQRYQDELDEQIELSMDNEWNDHEKYKQFDDRVLKAMDLLEPIQFDAEAVKDILQNLEEMLTIFNRIHESLQMVRDLKNDHSCAGGMQTVNRRIEHLEVQFDIQVSREEFDKLQSRSELMANIMIRQSKQIEALQKKLLKVEKNAMCSNITITGIVEDRNEDCIAKAMDIFESVLKAG